MASNENGVQNDYFLHQNQSIPRNGTKHLNVIWNFYAVVAVFAIYTVLLVGGIFGNYAIATIIWKNKKMHSGTNWLVFTLAISGLLISIVTVPLTLILRFIDWPFGTYTFGIIMCKYILPLPDHFAGLSVLTHTAVGLARYSIVKNSRDISTKLVCIIIVIIWALAFFFLSATLMGVLAVKEIWTDEKNTTTCILVVHGSNNSDINWEGINGGQLYTYFVFPLTYIIPIVLTGYSYFRIRTMTTASFRRVSRHLIASQFMQRQQRTNRMNKILMTMYYMFASTTLPFQLFWFVKHFKIIETKAHQDKIILEIISYFLFALFYAQIVTTPLVLFYMSIEYRKKLYDLPICCCVDKRKMRKFSTMVQRNLMEVGDLPRKISSGRKISNLRKISDSMRVHSTGRYSDTRKISNISRKISASRKSSGNRYNANRENGVSRSYDQRRKPSNFKNGVSNGNILNRLNEMNDVYSSSTHMNVRKIEYTIPEEEEEDEENHSSHKSNLHQLDLPNDTMSPVISSPESKSTKVPSFSSTLSEKMTNSGDILYKMNQLNILSYIGTDVYQDKSRRMTSPDVPSFRVLNESGKAVTSNGSIRVKNERKWVSNGDISYKIKDEDINKSRERSSTRTRKKGTITNNYPLSLETSIGNIKEKDTNLLHKSVNDYTLNNTRKLVNSCNTSISSYPIERLDFNSLELVDQGINDLELGDNEIALLQDTTISDICNHKSKTEISESIDELPNSSSLDNSNISDILEYMDKSFLNDDYDSQNISENIVESRQLFESNDFSNLLDTCNQTESLVERSVSSDSVDIHGRNMKTENITYFYNADISGILLDGENIKETDL